MFIRNFKKRRGVVKYLAGRFVLDLTLSLSLRRRGNSVASELVSYVVPLKETSDMEPDATELGVTRRVAPTSG